MLIKLTYIILKLLTINSAILPRSQLILRLPARNHRLVFDYLLHRDLKSGPILSAYLSYIESQTIQARELFLKPLLVTLRVELMSFEALSLLIKIISLQEQSVIEKFKELFPDLKPRIDSLLFISALVVIFNNQCPENLKAVFAVLLPRLFSLFIDTNMYQTKNVEVIINDAEPVHSVKPQKIEPDHARTVGFFGKADAKTIVNFSSVEKFLDGQPTLLPRNLK